MTIVARFAPSPTGPLHLGHAFSAILGHDAARAAGGRFLVRMEDIDASRVRPEYVDAILEDLAWLGLSWDGPVWRQSTRMAAYDAALRRLEGEGLVYPCFCDRRAIAAAADAIDAPHGPDGRVYPGTCRALTPAARRARIEAGAPHALRLDVAAAATRIEGPLRFVETGAGPAGETGVQDVAAATLATTTGDVVLARKDIRASYHLAVVVDDAAQGVTLAPRGEDLFFATPLHALLQRLLGLPTPEYRHHRLIRDAEGLRLATRDAAHSLAALRAAGRTPQQARALLAPFAASPV